MIRYFFEGTILLVRCTKGTWILAITFDLALSAYFTARHTLVLGLGGNS